MKNTEKSMKKLKTTNRKWDSLIIVLFSRTVDYWFKYGLVSFLLENSIFIGTP